MTSHSLKLTDSSSNNAHANSLVGVLAGERGSSCFSSAAETYTALSLSDMMEFPSGPAAALIPFDAKENGLDQKRRANPSLDTTPVGAPLVRQSMPSSLHA